MSRRSKRRPSPANATDFASISAELSMPRVSAARRRRCISRVSSPVPHPRSRTRGEGGGSVSGSVPPWRTSASRSKNGRLRSSLKRSYWSGFQAEVTKRRKRLGLGTGACASDADDLEVRVVYEVEQLVAGEARLGRDLHVAPLGLWLQAVVVVDPVLPRAALPARGGQTEVDTHRVGRLHVVAAFEQPRGLQQDAAEDHRRLAALHHASELQVVVRAALAGLRTLVGDDLGEVHRDAAELVQHLELARAAVLGGVEAALLGDPGLNLGKTQGRVLPG